jgi:hypothetical protein
MDYLSKILGMLFRVDSSSGVIRSKLTSDITPAYLVLGSAPGEDSHGRTFYENEHYWLLDYTPPKENSIDTSRFFLNNFANLEELVFLAKKLPRQFDAILFDYSSLKFFTGPNLVERLTCLKEMLKDTGSLYLENLIFSGITYSWENLARIQRTARESVTANQNYATRITQLKAIEGQKEREKQTNLLIEECNKAGLQLVARKPYTEYEGIEVVRDVFLTGEMPAIINNPQFEILHFQKISKGGRRIQKRRRGKTLKKTSTNHPKRS